MKGEIDMEAVKHRPISSTKLCDKSNQRIDVPVLVDFGERVRFLRLELRWSIDKLSEASNLHRNYISDVERGQRNISLKAIHQLANGLGVEIKDLF